MKKKKDLKQELIDAIQNEKRHFNMDEWAHNQFKYVGGLAPLTTCKTASCLGGHIVALRRNRAKQLMSQMPSMYTFANGSKPIFDVLARKIWEEETGERCKLDFYASRHRDYNGKDFFRRSQISRRQAIAHIKGTSKVWPQLG